MTSEEQILRIPLKDSNDDFVLVNVASDGLAPLDLRLLATEGESPYFLRVEQSNVQNYCIKSSELSEEQWEALLKRVLLRQSSEGKFFGRDSLETLEINATIVGDQLVIIFHKNISGIIQRLGEVSLNKDESQEIDPVNWAATAVLRSTALEEEVGNLEGKCDEQSKIIESLNQQLQALTAAKLQHENALLEKFRDLLNAKKLKIRDQQRLLSRSDVHTRKDVKEQGQRDTSAPLRATKRKATQQPATVTAIVSESENEEVSDKGSAEQEEKDPSDTDLETSMGSASDDEASNTLEFDHVPELQGKERNNSAHENVVIPKLLDRNLPPRRDLPFDQERHITKEATPKPQSSEDPSRYQVGPDQDAYETSDDEL